MKISPVLAFLYFFIGSILFTSYQKNTLNPVDSQREALSVKALEESPEKRVDNFHLQAEAIVVKETKNGVILFFKHQHNYYNGAFAFYTAQHKAELIHFIEGNDLYVEYDGAYIRLNNGKQSLYYIVNNEKGRNFVKQKTPQNVVYGDGLAYLFDHHFHLDKLPADNEISTDTMNESLSLSLDLQLPAGDEDCISGGKGATSCSVNDTFSGCSVSCADGYYACCKSSNNTCSCKKL